MILRLKTPLQDSSSNLKRELEAIEIKILIDETPDQSDWDLSWIQAYDQNQLLWVNVVAIAYFNSSLNDNRIEEDNFRVELPGRLVENTPILEESEEVKELIKEAKESLYLYLNSIGYENENISQISFTITNCFDENP